MKHKYTGNEFSFMAEWARRQKLEAVREMEGGEGVLRDTILCLRRGQHIYSVSPDTDHPEQSGARGGSALCWSVGVLRCDEFFYITDTGDRLILRRFTEPADIECPTEANYPTIGAYYYEKQGKRIVWKFVADRDIDDTTWKLWHHVMAGFKIALNMDDVIQRVEATGVEEGWDAKEIERRKTQGFACFVSECKGVRAVMCQVDRVVFKEGEPYTTD